MALDIQEKRTIDYVAPTVGASLVVALIFKKNKDWRVLLLFFLLAFGVIYILTSRITKMIYESGPAPVPTGGGCDGFDPTSYTDAMKVDMYDNTWKLFEFRKTEPYTNVLALADCQLIKVWNDWNSRYYKLYKENLKAAMEAETTGLAFDSIRSQLFNRFKTLGLA